MTQYFPIVVEQESNGTFSAWVAGLPGVYAAADTRAAAKRGVRDALAAHLDGLPALGLEPPRSNHS
jgi:predicted RNase H-like HicB family nuclease